MNKTKQVMINECHNQRPQKRSTERRMQSKQTPSRHQNTTVMY